MNTSSTTLRSRGFTLVEILVVLALLSMLLFMAVPGLKGTTAGSRVAQTADQFVQHMAIARQAAIKENIPVEVRLYKYNQTGVSGGDTPAFSAWQMYRLRQDMNEPVNYSLPSITVPILEKVARVANGVALVESKRWSSLVADDDLNRGRQLVRGLVPGVKETDTEYVSFIISPDGSTSLDRSGAKQWYVTFVDDIELKRNSSVEDMKPKDFITIQLDPYTASTRWFRP